MRHDPGGRLADAATGTGNDRDLARKASHGAGSMAARSHGPSRARCRLVTVTKAGFGSYRMGLELYGPDAHLGLQLWLEHHNVRPAPRPAAGRTQPRHNVCSAEPVDS